MTVAAAPADSSALTHRQILVVFSGLILAVLLAALDSTIVATALPTIVGELGGLTHLSWVVTAYLLAQTVVTPLYGKLGDLYGRKVVLQAGIVLFLIGSALCGLSQNMPELILFRIIQGLGGGGLIVTAQAVVGDIVAPRDRGRYQGIFGAVFGVSSIAGPLLGGFFTTQLSWRWIFYINLPLGILALAVLAITLPKRNKSIRRSIDFAGAGLLAVTLSAIILATDLGGAQFAWGSPLMLGLIAIASAALAGFVFVERRAAEPVLPLRLFRNRAFSVASCVGLIVGFALFGSVTYLPLFLQVVQSASPTASGLLMVPMMGGMLVTSIASGQLISRTGRYKPFPIIGTAVMAVGLLLLSRMNADTSMLSAALMMLVLGLGLGMVMQVLVIAVQNAVDYTDLGVATAAATLFRLMGGSLGTAVLGAIFSVQLATHLAALPAAAGAGGGLSPHLLAQLPATAQQAFAGAYTLALNTLFLVASGIVLIAFFLAWWLPQLPLRETVAAGSSEVGQAFAMPADDEALPQLMRGLAVLADRDVRKRHIEAIVARAGVELSAAAAWLLLRIEEEPQLELATLSRTQRADLGKLEAGHAELTVRALIIETGSAPGHDRHRELTAAGCDVLARLVAARRARLGELFSDWPLEKRAELAAVMSRLAHELVPEARLPSFTATDRSNSFKS